jgi:uncharacterized membrane protein AbrB (regulator of aidB expression)
VTVLQLTAVVHQPAAEAAAQAASPDGVVNVAVLLAAGFLVVVLVRRVRVVNVVVSALATVAGGLGTVVLLAVGLLLLFGVAMGLHALAG